MHIEITSHDIQVNPEHKKYVEEKLQGLEKYNDRMSEDCTHAKVEIKKAVNHSEGKHIECNVTLTVPRSVLRAEVHANQVTEAIDLAVSKLKKQLDKYSSYKDRMGHGCCRDACPCETEEM